MASTPESVDHYADRWLSGNPVYLIDMDRCQPQTSLVRDVSHGMRLPTRPPPSDLVAGWHNWTGSEELSECFWKIVNLTDRDLEGHRCTVAGDVPQGLRTGWGQGRDGGRINCRRGAARPRGQEPRGACIPPPGWPAPGFCPLLYADHKSRCAGCRLVGRL